MNPVSRVLSPETKMRLREEIVLAAQIIQPFLRIFLKKLPQNSKILMGLWFLVVVY